MISRMELLIIVAVVALLGLIAGQAACGKADSTPISNGFPVTTERLTGSWCGTDRMHDAQAGVTCWIYKCSNAGGISCLPDSALKGNH